jgi:NAD(P)-dependent dehydrogenase (short-subunit alcohol dehydrogenase family)
VIKIEGPGVAQYLGAEGAQLVLFAAPGDQGDLERALADLSEWWVRGRRARGGRRRPHHGREWAVTLALSRFGHLDVLVNNAGIGYCEHIFDMPLDHLDWTLAVNVRGTFAISIRAARAISAQGRGAIVYMTFTASIMGEGVPGHLQRLQRCCRRADAIPGGGPCPARYSCQRRGAGLGRDSARM